MVQMRTHLVHSVRTHPGGGAQLPSPHNGGSGIMQQRQVGFGSPSLPGSPKPSSNDNRKASNESLFFGDDSRKLSVSALRKTKDGLAHSFGVDELSPEDLIYNLFKIPNKSEASIGRLLMVLNTCGLRESDPRLRPMMDKIKEIERAKEAANHEMKDPRHWKLGKEQFKLCITQSISLIVQALQNDLIVPSWSQFTQIIKELFNKCKANREGKVATYIPQLSRVAPELWGLAICTVDGQRYELGDASLPFCCQSVSKAFNYAIAASEHGADIVHRYVGQEPSGIQFNSISLDSTNKPHNPMVNSGAIIVTSLIQNKWNMADRFDYVLTQYKKISGGEFVGFNNAVFLSERSTADRNFALSYYMKENNCFPPDSAQNLNEALDFYFQLCSLEITCESAAVMAATLANGGVCPVTSERCIGSRPCRDVLSLMNSCGMYDYSGQFAFHVGLPAKSGVSGVMIVVVPNLLGLALYSPRLDILGNSCRGVEFCREMVQRFNFHNYDSLAHSESTKFDPRRRFGDREKDQVVSLLFAAKAGDLNTVRRMYMMGADLEMADYDKRTALHLAASEGHFDLALFLLNTAKVRPDPKDRWNHTPLTDAKSQNHINVVHLLEKAMAIVESQQDEEEEEEEDETHHWQAHEHIQHEHGDSHLPTGNPHVSHIPQAMMLSQHSQLSQPLSSIPNSEADESTDEDLFDQVELGEHCDQQQKLEQHHLAELHQQRQNEDETHPAPHYHEETQALLKAIAESTGQSQKLLPSLDHPQHSPSMNNHHYNSQGDVGCMPGMASGVVLSPLTIGVETGVGEKVVGQQQEK